MRQVLFWAPGPPGTSSKAEKSEPGPDPCSVDSEKGST
jgi:hypothetical protein